MDRNLYVIAHDMRSTHNVGALMRLCDGMGVKHLYLTGYTPHPDFSGDSRLPHIGAKHRKAISKTALGAENSLPWSYQEDVLLVIKELQGQKIPIAGLEQDEKSIALHDFSPNDSCALLLGREVEGLDHQLIKACDTLLEIPMLGKKESHNVISAASMALYHCRFL